MPNVYLVAKCGGRPACNGLYHWNEQLVFEKPCRIWACNHSSPLPRYLTQRDRMNHHLSPLQSSWISGRGKVSLQLQFWVCASEINVYSANIFSNSTVGIYLCAYSEQSIRCYGRLQNLCSTVKQIMTQSFTSDSRLLQSEFTIQEMATPNNEASAIRPRRKRDILTIQCRTTQLLLADAADLITHVQRTTR